MVASVWPGVLIGAFAMMLLGVLLNVGPGEAALGGLGTAALCVWMAREKRRARR